MPPCGAGERTSWPPQPSEAEWLLHLLADQHWVSLGQVATNQNAASQQMWDQVFQLLATQQPVPAPMVPAAARPQWPLGVREQKMTPEDDRF